MTEPANPDIVVVGTRQSDGGWIFVRTSGVPTGINYVAIVGDATHPAYHDHPNFTDGEGMFALVIHEALHLTGPGNDFFLQSRAAWGNDARFYDSAHARNLELCMNALTMQALAAAGVATRAEAPPITPFDPPVAIASIPR